MKNTDHSSSTPARTAGHTQGRMKPWRRVGNYVQNQDGSYVFARCSNESVATLIAAAPELLEALKEIAELADMQKRDGHECAEIHFDGPVMTFARDAIAKAEGRAPEANT